MTIHSLYIYDRHCICVYYQDWHRTKRPKPAAEGGILPGVSQAVSPVPSNSAEVNAGLTLGFNSPRNTLSSTTGMVVAMNENSNQLPLTPLLQSPSISAASSTGLPFDEEAKLVYGVVISLRNMIKKLSGRDEQFVNYRTSAYKLHLFETLSGYKFVILSDPKTDSLRFVLRQIYIGPFMEYVVRNPLVKMDSRQQGIDNEYFRSSVDRLIRALSIFA
ncbi:TRAPP complex subunit bet5 [Phlegmacium glaucopus]|nr:TRAPP complex subunit bet5 [Phlegmacium glaucopus]